MNFIKGLFGTVNPDLYSQKKKSLILQLIEKKDIKNLTKTGIEHGFINDDIRIKAYSLLLNFHPKNSISKFRRFQKKINLDPKKKEELKKKFESIIKADVNRSLNSNELVFTKEKKYKIIHRDKLENVLTFFFMKFPNLSYYQGFNSIAEIFILYYGEELGFCLLDKFSNLMLKNFLDENLFDFEISKKQQNIIKIVKNQSGLVFEELHLGLLLGWSLTFFSHNIGDKERSLRIWDFLICLKIEEKKLEENKEKKILSDLEGNNKLDKLEKQKLIIRKFLEKKKLKKMKNMEKNKENNFVEILVAYTILEFIDILKVQKKDFLKNGFQIIKKFKLEIFKDENFENVFKKSYVEFLKKFLDNK